MPDWQGLPRGDTRRYGLRTKRVDSLPTIRVKPEFAAFGHLMWVDLGP